MKLDSNEIAALSPLFVDEISHRIFADRILYGLTSDDMYIHSIITTTEEGEKLKKILKKNEQRKIIFGAGSYGKWLYTYFHKDAEFIAFVDNDKKNIGKVIKGLPIISFEECKKNYSDCCIFVSPRYNYKEICNQLLDSGFPKNNIVLVGEFADNLAKKIYFDQCFITHAQNEIFVDAGAFKGESSLSFLKWCNGNYRHIYCFEPSPSVAEECRQNLFDKENVTVYTKGLWNEVAELAFEGAGTDSHVVLDMANFTEHVSVIDLDSVIDYKNIPGGGICKNGY